MTGQELYEALAKQRGWRSRFEALDRAGWESYEGIAKRANRLGLKVAWAVKVVDGYDWRAK